MYCWFILLPLLLLILLCLWCFSHLVHSHEVNDCNYIDCMCCTYFICFNLLNILKNRMASWRLNLTSPFSPSSRFLYMYLPSCYNFTDKIWSYILWPPSHIRFEFLFYARFRYNIQGLEILEIWNWKGRWPWHITARASSDLRPSTKVGWTWPINLLMSLTVIGF